MSGIPRIGATPYSGPSAAGDEPGLLSRLASLPGVSDAIRAVSTYNIGPVTRLLERAAYFPLLIAAQSTPVGDTFQVACEPRRFEIAAAATPAGIAGRNRVGGPAATLGFRWRVVPEDYVGGPGRAAPPAALPLCPEISQRIEIYDWELRFRGGASGFRAYGAGRTLPGAVAPGAGTGLAFVLDAGEGCGELAGLATTVVGSGVLGARGDLELGVVARVMDPTRGALVAPPPPLAGAPAARGATYLTFLGQVDSEHPVTLRISLTEGVLGSNVFELLRLAELDGDADAAGRPRGRADAGSFAGAVSARLSFDPLSLCSISPIQTRRGVFALHDSAGRSLGSIYSDMTEGRSFRTGLAEMLLPVFRFGGFGPILGGSGEFAGARGIMTMNSVVSVQPRTLSNLYVLRLEDPDGRYRAALGAPDGWAG